LPFSRAFDADFTPSGLAGDETVVEMLRELIMTLPRPSRNPGRYRRALPPGVGLFAADVPPTAHGSAWVSTELLQAIGLALLAIVLVFVIFKLTHRLLDKILFKLESWRTTRIPSLKIQSMEIVSSDRITDLLKSMARALRITLLAIVIYLVLPLVLSFFPWTRGLIDTMLPYIMAPVWLVGDAVVSFVPNLFFIAVILWVARYILKLNRAFFGEIKRGSIVFPRFHVEWADPTHKLIALLIVVFAVVLISPYLPGFGSPAFQGISIFLGVLLSLGSTAVVANIVAGAALTYMRPFRTGDRVQIADTSGEVTEKTLLITRLRTVKNVEVTIPNCLVLGSHIINYTAFSKNPGLVLSTSVTIGYDVPWRKVHELLIGAAHDTAKVLHDPGPFVLQTALNDFSVAYELNAYTAEPAYMASTYSALHANIQDRFNDAGIEILSPRYAAIRNGNESTIPKPD
jgi:small-conductance mechanosensitive channel